MAAFRLFALAALICLQAIPSVRPDSHDDAEDLARRMGRIACSEDADCEAITNAKCQQLTMFCKEKACVCPWGMVYVEGFKACAKPVVKLGEECNAENGCEARFSRCESGTCQCQSGFKAGFGTQCMKNGTWNNCQGSEQMVTIKNGTIEFTCPTQFSGLSGDAGLWQSCNENTFCKDVGSVCVECNPQSPLRTCSLIPVIHPRATLTPILGSGTTTMFVGVSALFGGLAASVLL